MNFTYAKPGSLAESLLLLEDLGDGTKVLAGGTDLLVQMRAGAIKVAHLVDLKGVPGHSGITMTEDGVLRLGALTPIIQLERSHELARFFPAVQEAVGMLGSWQTRQKATVGGNLCNASPLAEMARH